MDNLSPFCTCKNESCSLHPSKHDKGCAPCIQKNLRLKEIPNCFFHLVEGAEKREADGFRDFAQLVLAQKIIANCHWRKYVRIISFS